MYLYSMLYSMVLSTDTNFNVAVVSRAYIAGDALPPRPESHAAATATCEIERDARATRRPSGRGRSRLGSPYKRCETHMWCLRMSVLNR